ncbi:MAG: Hpt domain-containing protein [Planctomycetota bacterium]|nr:MAG: Hpt domain-containing protein [Planctomycetota bacterium]
MQAKTHSHQYRTFDVGSTLDRVDGDWEFLTELIDLFLQDNPRLMRMLNDAVARGDRAAVATLAHTLKGAASNFDATEVVQRALRLEAVARDEQDTDLRATWNDLQRAVAELRSEMTRFLSDSRSGN